MRRVLFVCTGNIFRSLAAEHAVRAALPAGSPVEVRSAGTEDYPHVVRPVVREYLRSRGFDVSNHSRRTLTREMLEDADLVVAMSHDHRAFIGERFGRQAALYTEACGAAAEPLPDVEDVIPDHATNPAAVEAHVRLTIDRILDLAPALAARIVSGQARTRA